MRYAFSGLGVTLETLTGRSHGPICNSLIIRYLFGDSVETMAFFCRVSTLYFVTN